MRYDHYICDGYGTLFNAELFPLYDSNEFVISQGARCTLVSNLGSLTGADLTKRLQSLNPKWKFLNVITSLDFALQNEELRSFSGKLLHFGRDEVKAEIGCSLRFVEEPKAARAVLFTSLPGADWIRQYQKVLECATFGEDVVFFLANPDRLLIEANSPYLTVAQVMDGVIFALKQHGIDPIIREFGKPYLSRADLGLSERERLLVIGDNSVTDGGLAQSLSCDFWNITVKRFFMGIVK